jgi:DeoR/GlpR family transcriptional regulator of sugar metabolism
MLKKERQAYILQQLHLHKKVVVSRMCKQIGVCIDTVRRDLDELAAEGKLIKVHGGALLHSFEHEVVDITSANTSDAAVIIGKKAAALVSNNLFVLTTGGHTVTEMARALRQDIHATFITGSVPLIIEYMAHPGLEVIIIGDKVSAKTKETSGVEAVDSIRRLRADLCFIDIRAIDVAGGIMENDWDIAQLKRAMIDSSQKVVGLVTSNNLHTFLPLPVCAVSQINCLITDLHPQHELLKPYADLGIQMM